MQVMRSLEELKKEANEINLNIRKLLLNKHVFEEGLSEKIAVVDKIAVLRANYLKIQREIRERFY